MTDETKAAKFSRLASARTTRALKAIRQIGNLSSRSTYDYTPQQVSKIITALQNALESIEARFTVGPVDKKTNDFSV